jgi:hypothetical protein
MIFLSSTMNPSRVYHNTFLLGGSPVSVRARYGFHRRQAAGDDLRQLSEVAVGALCGLFPVQRLRLILPNVIQFTFQHDAGA